MILGQCTKRRLVTLVTANKRLNEGGGKDCQIDQCDKFQGKRGG